MFAFGQSSARFAIKQSKMLLLQISIIVGGASIVSGSNWKSDLTNCDLRGFCQVIIFSYFQVVLSNKIALFKGKSSQ